jgi:uncharacterized protein YxeA
MKDVLVGIILLWVVWKIFGGRTIVHKYTFNQDNSHHPERPREGSIKVEKDPPKKAKKIDDQAGEYVDYEEIK